MQWYLSLSRLSVAPPTKINQQHWLIFCFCFSVLDHYGHHVIVKVWRLNSGLWNFMKWKEKSWVAGGPGAEDQSRLLSCLARLNTGLDLEFLTGIVQCALTALQKLWDPSIESVGHYNQNNHFGENFSNSMIDDWFGLHSIQYSEDTADIPSPPLLSPHGENPQVRPSHSSGRESFT